MRYILLESAIFTLEALFDLCFKNSYPSAIECFTATVLLVENILQVLIPCHSEYRIA